MNFSKIVILFLCVFSFFNVYALSEDWIVTKDPKNENVTYYVNNKNAHTLLVTKLDFKEQLEEQIDSNELESISNMIIESKKNLGINCTLVSKGDFIHLYNCDNEEKEMAIINIDKSYYYVVMFGGASLEDLGELAEELSK